MQSILEIMMATNDFINIRNVTLSFTNVSSANSSFRRNGRERSVVSNGRDENFDSHLTRKKEK